MPSGIPSQKLTTLPSSNPSLEPSLEPSLSPSTFPSPSPSDFPSTTSSTSPSLFPTSSPSQHPSLTPSTSPSADCQFNQVGLYGPRCRNNGNVKTAVILSAKIENDNYQLLKHQDLLGNNLIGNNCCNLLSYLQIKDSSYA